MLEMSLNKSPEDITIGDLRPGAIFVTGDGTLAVKTEYRYNATSYSNGQCMCILLENGEYAHFPRGDRTIVNEYIIQSEEP